MAAPNPLAGVDRWSSYTPRAMAGHLRDYELREPLHADGSQILGLDSLAIPVMNTTPVPGYTTQLCHTGLPFRINVIVVAEFWSVEDEILTTTFQLPPFMIMPTDYDGIHSWPTFLTTLRQSIEYKIVCIEGLPSGVSFNGIIALIFCIVDMNKFTTGVSHKLPNATSSDSRARLNIE